MIIYFLKPRKNLPTTPTPPPLPSTVEPYRHGAPIGVDFPLASPRHPSLQTVLAVNKEFADLFSYCQVSHYYGKCDLVHWAFI